MVKRTKDSVSYVKKLEERNRLLEEKNRIDERLAEIKRDLDDTVTHMRTDAGRRAARELFSLNAERLGTPFRDQHIMMALNERRQGRPLVMGPAVFEAPSKAYERARPIQGMDNGHWVMSTNGPRRHDGSDRESCVHCNSLMMNSTNNRRR